MTTPKTTSPQEYRKGKIVVATLTSGNTFKFQLVSGLELLEFLGLKGTEKGLAKKIADNISEYQRRFFSKYIIEPKIVSGKPENPEKEMSAAEITNQDAAELWDLMTGGAAGKKVKTFFRGPSKNR